MKKYYLLALLFPLLTFTACDQPQTGTLSDSTSSIVSDIDNDICLEFSADFIYSATSNTVVKIEPDWNMPKTICRYYFSYDPQFYEGVSDPKLSGGGAHIFISLENLSVENQKKGIEFLGGSIQTDSRIDMDHFLSLREDGSLRDVKLIINPNRYLRVEYGNQALTDDELITLAAQIASQIQGKSKLLIKTNPIELSVEQVEEVEQGSKEDPSENQEQVVRDFLGLLANKDFTAALAAMDANDVTKVMWQTNFATLDSLQVKNIQPIYEDEWTATRQVYQVDLEAGVNTAKYGWQNGANRRWITVEKSGNTWLVHEIANNP